MLFRCIFVIEMFAISVSFPASTTDTMAQQFLGPGTIDASPQTRDSTDWPFEAETPEAESFYSEDYPASAENTTFYERVARARSVRHMPNFLNKFFGGFGR